MATRVGLLSDKNLRHHCLSYQAFSVGFANADFGGNLGNPFLPGIKTPKYQRSAPKPISADVMAVNRAKFMQGNRFSNAGNILRQYQNEAREWTPPPVKLVSANVDESIGRAVIASRGTQIIRETIGTQSENPALEMNLSQFHSASAPTQQHITESLLDTLNSQNVIFSQASPSVPEMLTRAYTQGARVDESVFLNTPSSTPKRETTTSRVMSPRPLSQDKAREPRRNWRAPSSDPPAVRRSQTQANRTGIAQPATTSTSSEVEKK